MIGTPGPAWKLLLSLALPTALVGFGMLIVRDVRVTFALYLLIGCGLSPWLLLGARPFRTGNGLPWSASGSTGLDRQRLAAWLAFGPLFLAGYALLRRYIGDPERYLAHLRELGWRDEYELVYALLFVALIPLAEEWWWRGQALPRCVARYGRWPGLLLAASAYAGYHVFTLAALYDTPSTAIRLSGILLAGLVWSVMALRRAEWGLTYFAHLGADMAIAVAFFIFVT